MSIAVALAYFVVGAAIVTSEFARATRMPVDALRIATVFFVVAYVIIPIVLALGVVARVNPFYYGGIKYFGSWYAPCLVAIGYVWLRLAHWVGSALMGKDSIVLRASLSDGLVVALLYVAAGVVGVSIIVYVGQFGGIRNTIIQTELIRNGVIEGGAFEFVKHFFRLNGLCLAYTFYRAFVAAPQTRRSQLTVLFWAFFVLFLLLVVLWNGRGYVIFTAAILYFIVVNARRRFYPARLGALAAGALVFFLVGNYIFIAIPVLLQQGFGAFADTFSENIVLAMDRAGTSAVQGFVHPIASLEMALVQIRSLAHMRYFMDLPLGVVHLMPQRLTGIAVPDGISYFNTMLHQGIWKSVIPPGILALGAYSLGALGVPLIMVIYGALCGAFDRWSARLVEQVPAAVALYVVVAFEVGYFVVNGDPRRFFNSTFALALAVTILCVFVRMRRTA